MNFDKELKSKIFFLGGGGGGGGGEETGMQVQGRVQLSCGHVDIENYNPLKDRTI